jgi:S-DNA-T family DNA segregation ATPase FtsK/SpoIIIE
MDSRIILDDSGAERLLPNGDMLFLAPGIGKPTRHHGPYLSDTEIHNVVNFWAEQGDPEYDSVGMKILDSFSGGDSDSGLINETSSDGEDHDEKYDEILSWASDQKEVSASLIQRRFRLGYPRAARLIEIFEKEGVVGPANGSKPRQVLVRSYSEGP